MKAYTRRLYARRGVDEWREGDAQLVAPGRVVITNSAGNVLFDASPALFSTERAKGRIRLCLDEGCPHYNVEHSHQ